MILKKKDGIWHGVIITRTCAVRYKHASAGRVMFVLAMKKVEVDGAPK